ncbi:hypothetical protein [Methylophilus medardicus]|uniref:hypothetical protein n=1 Tax=Methylophilus medardicus TaxID=2588534 RepID=UPI00167922EF|nr:hypothetical protein [Methylophilus medardicus]
MKPLNCFTLFLASDRKFKLESGESFDDLARLDEPLESSALTDDQMLESGKFKSHNGEL